MAACEAVSIRGICANIGFPQLTPTVLKMDNSGAIDLATDPVQHAKSKHIARRDLFLRELVERGIIVPKYVPTPANIADSLTKPLDRSQFVAHRATMLYVTAKGDVSFLFKRCDIIYTQGSSKARGGAWV